MLTWVSAGLLRNLYESDDGWKRIKSFMKKWAGTKKRDRNDRSLPVFLTLPVTIFVFKIRNHQNISYLTSVSK